MNNQYYSNEEISNILKDVKEKSIEESEELNKYVNPFIVNYFLETNERCERKIYRRNGLNYRIFK